MENKDIIEKIKKEKNVVFVGKNGVGKTHTLKKIHANQNINSIFIDYNLENNYDHIIKNLISSKIINEDRKKIEEYIEKSTQQITNILSNFDDVQNKNKYEMIYSKHKIDIFKGDLLENSYNLKYNYDNGTGINYFLKIQLLLDLIDKNSDTFLLIDEPEKYCFPGLVKKLANILSNHTIRVVCSSHSPIFIASFIKDFSELIFMKNKCELHCFTSKELIDLSMDTYKYELNKTYFKSKGTLISKKERYARFFESILKKKIIKSLYSDVTIVVEGPTDRQLIDYILNSSNEFYYINILQSNGKDMFPVYISILKAYGISLFSIFDSDNYKDNKHKIYNEYIKRSCVAYYEFPDNIEISFGLNKTAKKEKQCVGPTLLLMEILDENDYAIEIINDIKEKIKLACLSNVVGENNLIYEMDKLLKILNNTNKNDIENSMSTYIMYHFLNRKYIKLGKKSYNKLSIDKELEISYFNLKSRIKCTQMKEENYRDKITEYKKNILFKDDILEFVFYIYDYDVNNRSHDLKLIRDLDLHEKKANLFEEYKSKENYFDSFENYLLSILVKKIEKIENKYFEGKQIISTLEPKQLVDEKVVLGKVKKELDHLKFLEKKEKKSAIMDEYHKVLKIIY